MKRIANLSDAQFKTLVIRTLTEMVEHGCKIEEKVKDMQSEIKENVQGTKSDGKETILWNGCMDSVSKSLLYFDWLCWEDIKLGPMKAIEFGQCVMVSRYKEGERWINRYLTYRHWIPSSSPWSPGSCSSTSYSVTISAFLPNAQSSEFPFLLKGVWFGVLSY